MGEGLKLGVIGGSFDPVHLGHLGIAEEAREEFGLEKVVFVPAAQPPHKGGETLAPAEDRLAMVEAAVRDNPHFVASDVEMRREGPSYTIDTLKEIQRMYPEAALSFIVGSDSLEELHSWRNARELVTEYEFIIVARPGARGPDFGQLSEAFGGGPAQKLRDSYLETEPYNISATDIRRRVKIGRSIRYLVPPQVERYIMRAGLYRA